MKLGIDGSNIRRGGGVTHLVELLHAAKPTEHGFSKVVVWAGSATLARIKDRPWLLKAHDPLLDRSLPWRVFWQRFRLNGLARLAGCDLLFVPGGTDASGFTPMVTMSQNLLPFEWRELLRYGISPLTLKLVLLRLTQTRSIRKADGVIFLTRYAQGVVSQVTGPVRGKTAVVPHGIHSRFLMPPRDQRRVEAFTVNNPCRVLYVSIVDQYKHQWHVAEAVAQLRAHGLPVTLDLVGPAYGPALRRLRQTLLHYDPDARFMRYLGPIEYSDLHEKYGKADISVFASSCETFGQILVEAMAAGLPNGCSNRSAMPELLGDAGIYFDPENPAEIAAALRQLIESPELRAQKAQAAFERAQRHSWEHCADETFSFLAAVGKGPR